VTLHAITFAIVGGGTGNHCHYCYYKKNVFETKQGLDIFTHV
jgi:hypothetical protein